MRKAVFFDRDGVLNVDKSYLGFIKDFEWMDGAKEALAYLTAEGYAIIVVTNQSGVARGYYTEDDVKTLHDWMCREAAATGGTITAVYYCPYLEGAPIKAYDKKSDHTHIINNDHSDGRAIFKKCPKCGRFYNGGEYYCNCCHVKLEIIEENKKSSVQYKDETHIPKCPTCGSTDIKKISGISKATSVALWGILSQKVKNQWHCNNCSSEW